MFFGLSVAFYVRAVGGLLFVLALKALVWCGLQMWSALRTMGREQQIEAVEPEVHYQSTNFQVHPLANQCISVFAFHEYALIQPVPLFSSPPRYSDPRHLPRPFPCHLPYCSVHSSERQHPVSLPSF